jgi:hypothetical protein
VSGSEIQFLDRADGDIVRLRAILVSHAATADEAWLIEFVRLARQIFESAVALGLDRVSDTARTIVDLAQDCFPARFNFGHGANLQLNDLLVELKVRLFEAKTGDPFPAPFGI